MPFVGPNEPHTIAATITATVEGVSVLLEKLAGFGQLRIDAIAIANVAPKGQGGIKGDFLANHYGFAFC